MNRIQRNLTGSKISTSGISKFVIFGRKRENQDGRPGLIGCVIFDLFSETAEQNSTKLEGNNISTYFSKFVFLGPIGKPRWQPWPHWLCHFRRLLWNRWTEFNETWQETTFQRTFPSLCFSGRSENQDGRPGYWFAGTFSTSSLKQLNGIRQNLILD